MDNYEITQPTSEEIKEIIKKHGLTREEAAAMVHASKRTWDNWCVREDGSGHRKMPLAVYELLLIKLGVHPKYGERS